MGILNMGHKSRSKKNINIVFIEYFIRFRKNIIIEKTMVSPISNIIGIKKFKKLYK